MNNGIGPELCKSERKLRKLEKALLDASLSASLNSCLYGSSCIKLLDASASELYRRLSSDGTVKLKRPVRIFDDDKINAVSELMSRLGVPLGITVGDVGCEVDFEELRGILANMCRRDRLALDMEGESLLYLFLCFIGRKDASGNASACLPLVLLPVALDKDGEGVPCVISRQQDREIITNPVLVNCLREEGIELPLFEQGEYSLEEYFEAVSVLLEGDGDRCFVDGVALGLASLKSIRMYDGIRKSRKEIKAHPIFRALSGDAVLDMGEGEGIGKADSDMSEEPFCVLGADASQMRAVLCAERGESFVISGAPGTGKSQTVANIIAGAAARGKRVLFLADTREAHRAVIDCLASSGLGDLTLPLYDGTRRIKELLAGIGGGLRHSNTGRDTGTVANLGRLDHIKKELGRYISELHRQVFAINRSLYGMLTLFEENVGGLVVEYTPSVSVREVTESDYSAQESAVARYAAAVSATGCAPRDNPWRILNKHFDRSGIAQMKSDVTALYSVLSDCKRLLGEIHECPGLSESLNLEMLSELPEMLLRISELPSVSREYLSSFDAERLRGIISDAQAARAEVSAVEKSANGAFIEGFGATDEFNAIFAEHSRCTRELTSLGMTIGDIKNCLSRYDAVIARLSRIEENASKYREAVANASVAFGIDLEVSFSDARKAILILDSVVSPINSDSLLDLADIDSLREDICTVRDIVGEIEEIRSSASDMWRLDIFEECKGIDIDALRDCLEGEADVTDGKSSQDEYGDILRRYWEKGEAPDIMEALRLCDILKEYNGLVAVYTPLEKELEGVLRVAPRAELSYWEAVLSGVERIWELKGLFNGTVPESVRKVISKGNVDGLYDLRKSLSELFDFSGRRDDLDVDFSFVGEGDACLSLAKCRSALERLYEALLVTTPYLLNCNVSIEDIYDAISALSSLGVSAQRANNLEALISKVFDGIEGAFADGSVDTRLLMHHIDMLEAVRNMPLYPYLEALCCCNDSRKSELQGLSRTLSELCTRVSALEGGITRIRDSLFEDVTLCNELCGGSIDGMARVLSPYAENLGGIESHLGRLSVILEAKGIGLGDFIDRAEEKGVFGNIAESFRKSFACAWINEALRDSGIREISTELCEDTLFELSALCKASLEMNSDAVRRAVEGAFLDDGASEELIGRLYAGSCLSLRRLFELIPVSILTLRPCLMTTLAAAAEMPRDGRYSFDLVIIDGASQLSTSEAVCAIARGKQIIAVGDIGIAPISDGLFSEYGADTDVRRSFLEELLCVLPSVDLKVHYRSADEALIDFSNVSFYGGRLVTFPASTEKSEERGVEYLYLPQGRYAGGVNVAEVEKCIALVSEHIKRSPDKTLGVIALEDSQREAIEHAVAELTATLPELSVYFEECEAKGSPFFVKSIGELCGETRDSIIISICYAKNENGEFYPDFGDIGCEDGDRRLNAAVTSARECIKVIGSVRPVDFSLTADSPIGSRMLYEYIKYACEGGRFDTSDLNATRPPVWDGFRDAVADFISENDYSVVRCLGRCADYKVDIAVESRRGSGAYAAAIECDGAYRTKSGNIADSFITRPEMLDRLGWRCYRIGALAWYLNPERERKALLEFLREAVPVYGGDAADIEGASDINSSVRPTQGALSGADSSTISHNNSEKDGVLNAIAVSVPSTLNTEKSRASTVKSEDFGISKTDETICSDDIYNPYGFAVYQRSAPHAISEDSAVLAEILKIVRLEEPIHKELLIERIAECLAAEGTGQGADRLVENLLSNELSDALTVDSEGFVRSVPSRTAVARACADTDSRRAIEHISCEELSACVVGILGGCGMYDCDEIYAEISAILGYPRDYEEFFAPVKIAVYELVAKGVIVNDDGMLRLV